MKISYILTAFSPAMFGEKATAHFRVIDVDEAQSLVDENTQIVATRISHERLARNQFDDITADVTRYADLRPGRNAIHVQYRGPAIREDGEIPFGGSVTFYLIEVDEYHDP